MQTAALIFAAGMSQHTRDFKPMLSIGSISVAQRVIATFHQAGIQKIVMVTGYNAEVLEHHLTGNGLIFLRNENYETTKMFASVKIGLDYLRDKCDRLLLTPVDVPLFTAKTVQMLLDTQATLACPVCDNQQGHPILIDKRMFSEFLEDCGEQGLEGALERCTAKLCKVAVDDLGTIYDADTQEAVPSLLEHHNDTKAAAFTMIECLMESVGCTEADIARCHLSGAFPAHSDLESAITIGMFPDLPRDRYSCTANTSLDGARILLLNRERMEEIQNLTDNRKYVLHPVCLHPGFSGADALCEIHPPYGYEPLSDDSAAAGRKKMIP